MFAKFLCLNVDDNGEATDEAYSIELATGGDIIDLARAIAQLRGFSDSLHLLTLWKPKRFLLSGQQSSEKIVKATFQGFGILESNPNVTQLDPLSSIEEYYDGEPEGGIQVLVRFAIDPLDAPQVKPDNKSSSSEEEALNMVGWESLLTTKIHRWENLNNLTIPSVYLNGVTGIYDSIRKTEIPTFFANFLAQLYRKRTVEHDMFESLEQKLMPEGGKAMIYYGQWVNERTHHPCIPASELFQLGSDGEKGGRWHVSIGEYAHYMLVLNGDIMTNLSAFQESPRHHFYGLVYGVRQLFASSEGKFVCNGYWDFSLVIAFEGRSEKRVYRPKNALDIRFKGIPHLIVEVISDRNKSNRNRMLLQAVCLARFGNKIRRQGSDPFIVSAIYIDDWMNAIWYYVYDQGGKVTIMSKEYKLTHPPRAGEFLVRLYNAAHLAAIESENFTYTAAPIAEAVQALQERGYSTMLDIPFRSEEHTNLALAGYRIQSDLSDDIRPEFEPHPLPPPLIRAWNGRHRYVVKYGERTRHELKIFQHLSAFTPEDHHIIRLVKTIKFGNGPALIFPELMPLTAIVKKCTATQLRCMCMQFLSGVAFLHEHQVAHLDLKPDNILIEELDESMSLYIHDLDLAKIVEDENTMFSGNRGTKGWVPPEEYSDEEFSAIRADRWATGKVIFFFLRHIKEHAGRDMLIANFARNLMKRDPKMRPPVNDVVNQIQTRLTQVHRGLKRPHEYIQ